MHDPSQSESGVEGRKAIWVEGLFGIACLGLTIVGANIISPLVSCFLRMLHSCGVLGWLNARIGIEPLFYSVAGVFSAIYLFAAGAFFIYLKHLLFHCAKHPKKGGGHY